MTEDTHLSSRNTRRRFLSRIVFAIVATTVVVAVPAFAIGFAAGYVSASVERGNQDISVVNDIIAGNPDYSGLSINRGPLDKFRLEGTVSSQLALDALKQELTLSFGAKRADYVLAVELGDMATTKNGD